MQTHHENINTSVRIQVNLLDSLMNLAGELVLGRNQLLQAVSSDDKRLLETTSQRIDLVTSEIQEQIMRTRMQPMDTLFGKLPRVVRDLSQEAGKQVNLSITGKSVEIDKSIMEAIEEPLNWMVRQAVSQGIEPPDVRQHLKKPRQASLKLSASHEVGQVIIDIIDDGKGVDPQKIVQHAVQHGLLSEKQASDFISGTGKMDLFFLPDLFSEQDATGAFSQFAGIADIKTRLEKIGGTFDLSASSGHGTHMCIKLPMTLSIIPSQIITLGDEHFAIPQVNLQELLRIPANQVKHMIEKVGDASVVRLRGELLPVIDLAQILGLARFFVHPADGQKHPDRRQWIADRRSMDITAPPTDYEGRERRSDQDRRYRSESALDIAVVSTGKLKFGLVVDGMNDAEEIVVKPLGNHLRECHGFAGATIMGDGKVALILDVASIGEMAKLNAGDNGKPTDATTDSVDRSMDKRAALQSYLFFNSADKERFAVPLDTVNRIEKIDANRIETVSGNRVLKYRGGVLPLIALDEAITVTPLPESDHYQAICFTIDGREIGILSTPPIDAVDVEIKLDTKTLQQPGVTGSAVIMDQTTLLLDIHQVVKNAKPDFFR
jgi:two-component system, chemotaxis family, sensor kinase CheA